MEVESLAEDLDVNLEDATDASQFCKIQKLSKETSTAIRKGQIVTKISDVVRELVDNAIDANASSVQVLLANYGIDKIEVKDTGRGISSSEFNNAVAGGYTSKLKHPEHPSCCKAYGFRGEALSSICSVANVSVTTKTLDELKATKYILDYDGRIVTESKVAYGNGTVVTVEKIFNNYPVRRQWIQDKSRRTAELKDIETYLKAIAIANPQCHISFYHDGSLIWTKATVPTIDQALITVLGHSLSKNLVRCGPVKIEVDEEEKLKRTLETFLLKKPIDMRTMSFTSNKLTMIFVNRKRVYVREFEKLIQQYTAAIIEKPAPADQRRFPVAVVNIRVPSNEVDFNRDMDKSKIFLIYKEEIKKKLEEVLINFYGIDLNKLSVNCKKKEIEDESQDPINNRNDITNTTKERLPDATTAVNNITQTATKSNDMAFPKSPISSRPSLVDPGSRSSTILEFLGDIPSSANFSQSPQKESFFAKFPTPVKKCCLSSSNNAKDLETDKIDSETKSEKPIDQCGQIFDENSTKKPAPVISNFELNLDDVEESPELVKNKEAPKLNFDEWIHGRMTDGNGEIIQNVLLVNRPPSGTNALPNLSMNGDSVRVNSRSFNINASQSSNNTQQNAFELIGSGFSNMHATSALEFGHPVYKRPRMSFNGHYDAATMNACKASSSGTSLSSTPKQVTLESYKNWQTPGRRLSQPQNSTPTGVRLALSGSASQSQSQRSFSSVPKRIENAIGIPPKSVKDYWGKVGMSGEDNNNKSSSGSLLGIQRNINMDTSCFSCSQNSSQSNSRSKLIGPISGSGLYAAQVKESIGAFSPLSMLRNFPTLKYDMNISIEKSSASPDSSPESEKSPQYIVAKEDVPKLFNEFLNLVDPSSELFAKIFHSLANMKDFQQQDQQSFLSNSSAA